MKFIIDAQLPYGLKLFLNENGHDALHIDDMINKERTLDSEIIKLSIKEERIVITKDNDFLNSHIINKKPKKLLLIVSGNIRNREFYSLFKNNYKTIINLFESNDLIELDVDGISGY